MRLLFLFTAVAAALSTLDSSLEERKAKKCKLALRTKNVARNAVCGQAGHVAKRHLIRRQKSCTKSKTGCYIACRRRKGCKSFAYNKKKNICSLYNSTVRKAKFRAGVKSRNIFYDRKGCFKKPKCKLRCKKRKTPTNTATKTKTVTTTVTPKTTPTTPAACNNAGIQWAYYQQNPEILNRNGDEYATQFDTTIYKTVTPSYQDTTPDAGLFIPGPPDGSPTRIYQSTTELTSSFFALNHRGFFYPPKDDTYTVTLAAADDYAWLWLGNKAFSGWNNNNSDLSLGRLATDPVKKNFVLKLGTYYPFRVMLGEASDTIAVTFSISDSKNNTIVGGPSGLGDNFVQFACGKNARKYPAFGKET